MPNQDVNIIIKARDEAVAKLREVERQLSQMGLRSTESALAANEQANAFIRSQQAMFTALRVAGSLRVGIDAVLVGSKAMRGEWEGVRDSLFQLPFGLGRVAQSLNEILGIVTGWADETERIQRATEATNASMQAGFTMRAGSAGAISSMGDAMRSMYRERLTLRNPNRSSELGLEFQRQDEVTRMSSLAEQAKRQAAAAAEAGIAAQRKALAESFSGDEAQSRIAEMRRFTSFSAYFDSQYGTRFFRSMNTPSKRAEVEKEFNLVRAADAEIERLRRLHAEELEKIEQAKSKGIESINATHAERMKALQEKADAEELAARQKMIEAASKLYTNFGATASTIGGRFITGVGRFLPGGGQFGPPTVPAEVRQTAKNTEKTAKLIERGNALLTDMKRVMEEIRDTQTVVVPGGFA